MHSRHVTMSLQLLIALRQPLLSKSGQKDGHPMLPSDSSSPPAPQVLSAPPQDLLMLPLSFPASVVSTVDVFGSVMQFVDGGSEPFTFAPSHFCSALVRPCTYLADALARSRSHLTGSARTVVAPVSSPTMTKALTSARTVMCP